MPPTPFEQAKFKRALLQTLLLPSLLMALLAVVMFWQINRLRTLQGQVDHSNTVIAQGHRVEKLLVDMETGVRGFLVTGSHNFLEPYEKAAVSIEPETVKLSTLVGDNATQQARVEQIRSSSAQWRVYARDVITSKSVGGDDDKVNVAAGKRLMDRIRDEILSFVSAEEQVSKERSLAADKATRLLLGLSVGLTFVLGLGLAAFSHSNLIGISRSYDRALRAARERTTQATRSEERYRLLFESNPQPLWVYDIETLAFLAVNDAAIEHYGFSRAEFLNMTIKDIRPPQDVPALVENISHLSDGLEQAGIWTHRKKDGSLIKVEITSHTIDYSGRRAEIVLANDVTQRLLAEQSIRALNDELEKRVNERTAQLEQANKELEAFTYSVSHDLRAPLRAVNGFSRILLDDYEQAIPPDARRYLTLLRTNATQMGQLIDDLLAFSRLSRQSVRKQPIEIRSLVEGVINDLQSEREGRSVSISVGEFPAMEADPALLKQVYTNLLSNAFKYTRGRNEARVEVGSTTNGNSSPQNVFFVRDNGAGFDMRYAHKLFGVFQRLHRAEEFEGTGVGLAITERIIRRHGGRIWAEAEVDHGATFFFTLDGEASE